jgi:predicted DNA-binding transcriptional regulator YafY
MNRIDRLTATLIQLQSKRVVRAEEIAERFGISLRTVYRDVKALMEAGVPIGSEAGKGYFIVDGYHLPPVMFSQDEASALLTGGKLIEKMTDASIRKAYESALLKITSVLNAREKDHLENLQSSIAVYRGFCEQSESSVSNMCLVELQRALSFHLAVDLSYRSRKDEHTRRLVHPIGLVFYSGHWHLIGWCTLRQDYRDFRVDLIRTMTVTDEEYDSGKYYSLKEYFEQESEDAKELQKVVVTFRRTAAAYARNARSYYGFVSEQDLGDHIRMNFLVSNLHWFCRWLMMYGANVEIEEPTEALEVMTQLVSELQAHYAGALTS